MESFDVLILGAGIVGAATAYECTRSGMRVGIVEPAVPAGGAGAAGMGHLVVMDDSPAQLALTHYSRELWRELRPALPQAVEYEECGTLWVSSRLSFAPQGTLAERMRAGGAGIPAFFTPAGVGTLVAEGKEHCDFDGKTYIVERGIRADVSLVKAWKGDRTGNLIYRKTARNFNPMAATCGQVKIAEVEEIVATGEIDTDLVPTPGIYVDRIVLCPNPQSVLSRKSREVPRNVVDTGTDGSTRG